MVELPQEIDQRKRREFDPPRRIAVHLKPPAKINPAVITADALYDPYYESDFLELERKGLIVGRFEKKNINGWEVRDDDTE